MPTVMESTMMEARTGSVVEVVRTPHRRWRSVSKPRTTPYPTVPIVVVTRIGWAIHIVVVPIRITGNRCHNRRCHNRRCRHHWGRRNHGCRRCHNHWRRSYRATKDIRGSTDCLNPQHVVPAMMTKRHKSNARCKCHDCQFLVHCLFLHWKLFTITIYIIQHTLRYVKGVWKIYFQAITNTKCLNLPSNSQFALGNPDLMYGVNRL